MLKVVLLLAVTAFYAAYNLLVKISSLHVPTTATTTVLATICLQVAALCASTVFAAALVLRGGHTLALSPAAYGWAVLAGLAIGAAEICYFYLFTGLGGGGRPMAANVAIPFIVVGTIVITFLVSHLVLHESVSVIQLAGAAVVVAGLAMMYFAG